MIRIISDLWYDSNIELLLFRNQLIDRNVSEILHLIEYAKEFVQKPISIFNTVEIAKKIKELNLPPSKIDVGKLAYDYHIVAHNGIGEFVTKKLVDAKNSLLYVWYDNEYGYSHQIIQLAKYITKVRRSSYY